MFGRASRLERRHQNVRPIAAVATRLKEVRDLIAPNSVQLDATRRWGLTPADLVWVSPAYLTAVLKRSNVVHIGEELSRVDRRFEMVILVQSSAVPAAGVPAAWGHYFVNATEDSPHPVELARPSRMVAVDNGPLIEVLGRDELADLAIALGLNVRMLDGRDRIVAKIHTVEDAVVVRSRALRVLTGSQYTVWIAND